MSPDSGLLRVVVTSKTLEAVGICSFELTEEHGEILPSFSAGSHIDVHIPGGFVRQYSLCNDSSETHRYLIAVLEEQGGRGGSAAMHALVKVGDVLSISVPKNHFSLASGTHKSCLLAGGIGVTPILCMAERLHKLKSEFQVHYAARSLERTAFRGRILESQYASRVSFHFDDGDAIQKLDISGLLGALEEGTHLYVCGPKGFMDGVLRAASELNWPESQVHYEFFAADIKPKASDGSFEVQIASSGRVVVIPAEKSVTQVLEKVGIKILTACEQGICGTCLTRVLQGIPDHRDMYLSSTEQKANDQFLPCCSRAKSDRLVLDL